MRNRKKIITATTLVLIIGMLITGCSGSTKLAKDAAAMVNGNSISLSDFEKTLAFQRMSYETQFGSDILNQEVGEGMTLLDSLKNQILEMLIVDELLLQEAAKNNITVTEEEIKEVYDPYKEYTESNEDYKAFAEENNLDEAYIKGTIEKDILIHKYKDFYLNNLDISKEAAKAYYDDNQEFFLREEVSAKHILVRSTVEGAKEKAEDILSKINGPDDFMKLWEGYQQQPEEGIVVEDLGYFRKGEMVPEFENKAFSMKANEVSDIVETTFGYHIILVEDIINEIQVYEEIEEYLIQFLKDQDFQEHIETLKSEAKIVKREEL